MKQSRLKEQEPETLPLSKKNKIFYYNFTLYSYIWPDIFTAVNQVNSLLWGQGP